MLGRASDITRTGVGGVAEVIIIGQSTFNQANLTITATSTIPESGEIGMTAYAGQTSTKISIVNSKLNNDNSKQDDSNTVNLLQDTESVSSLPECDTYIEAVPVPVEWRSSLEPLQSVSCTTQTSQRPLQHQQQRWPPPESISSNVALHLPPLWTRRNIQALFVYHKKRHILRTRRISRLASASTSTIMKPATMNPATASEDHPDTCSQQLHEGRPLLALTLTQNKSNITLATQLSCKQT